MSHMLLVEADGWLRALIEAELKEAGHQVTAFASIEGAEQVARWLFHDLAIVDAVGQARGDLDRLDALCRATRVLLCAGAFDLEGVTAAELPVVALLRRPFSIRDLVVRVGQALSKGSTPALSTASR